MDITQEALKTPIPLEYIMTKGPIDILNSAVNTGPAMVIYSYVSKLKSLYLFSKCLLFLEVCNF